ncbi:MAG: LytTR family transcriptional regulator DNA-binding domain-containing protein [Proteobacteria bacterium]|nr:LytTR family transcriptional regulator DNA-binding domain-containing protein [Pseudomonadota bacterium]
MTTNLIAGSVSTDGLVYYSAILEHRSQAEANYENLNSLDFRKADSSVLHLGFGTHPYWIRIDPMLSVKGNQRQWILELATCKLKRVDLYYTNSSGGWSHQLAGSHVSPNLQQINGRSFVFMLTDADMQKPIFLRIESIYFWVPIHIWNVQDYFDKEQNQVLSDGIFFGVVFAIVCYHLFIFLALRNRSYLHYASFLSVVLLWYFSGEGWAFSFLFSKWPPPLSDLTHLSSPFLGWLLLITGIQFTRVYLRLWIHSRWLDKILIYYQWVLGATGILGMVLLIFGMRSIFASLYNFGFVLIVLAILLCFLAGYQGYRSHQATARYYLIATLLQFTVAIIMVLSVFEWLPIPYSWKILQISSIIEMLIFSFGLSRQVQQVNQEKEIILGELKSTKENLLEHQATIDQLQDRVLTRVMESRLYPEIAKLFPILNRITYIQAIGNYSRVVYREDGMENEMEIQAGLKDIEKCFSSDHFIRIHKTYMVRSGIEYTLQRRSSADYDMVSRDFVLPVGRKFIKLVRG